MLWLRLVLRIGGNRYRGWRRHGGRVLLGCHCDRWHHKLLLMVLLMRMLMLVLVLWMVLLLLLLLLLLMG